VKTLDEINKDLEASNRFTDDNGALIGSNWINYAKEKPPHGDWFTAIWLADGYQIECNCRWYTYLDSITNEYQHDLEIEEDDCQWLLQEAFNPWNKIIYWKYPERLEKT